ncbi:MAG TPA: DegT/DnrJ/EryC1/StrS family aminotransferase [Stellaceae bacterium]|nr:DegT/DnrJ/EryC1/StrS family aminotransferase [Stellaceae bacterium]
MTIVVPTFRPRLPAAETLLPFLREIDAHRWYSNFGPLNRRFESALAEHFRAPRGTVVSVANATLGMSLALQDAAHDAAGFCMVPAWTHAATAAAIVAAGLTPWFVDVDARSWQLTPDAARRLLAAAPERPLAVLAVSPFGGFVDAEAWDRYTDDTGIPVVIDAAAAFDTVRPARTTVQVVSLHATKAFGIGEGGLMLVGDERRAERLRRMSNFGLDRDRKTVLPGTNAKLSEYAAAVGLARLQEWPTCRAQLIATARRFLTGLAALPGVAPMPALDGATAITTANVILPRGNADAVIAFLRDRGIEARKWWAGACHRHPQFAACPRASLDVTEELADRVLGLPFFADITDEQLRLVFDELRAALASGPA